MTPLSEVSGGQLTDSEGVHTINYTPCFQRKSGASSAACEFLWPQFTTESPLCEISEPLREIFERAQTCERFPPLLPGWDFRFAKTTKGRTHPDAKPQLNELADSRVVLRPFVITHIYLMPPTRVGGSGHTIG